jgi:hypothetical protein
MDKEEYKNKYINLRILKSIQDYLKTEGDSTTAVYPIKVPEELICQVMALRGAESTDRLISHIFRLGLNIWSEKLYREVFGSNQSLEEFIELVKKENKESR